jgi:hypothetical protein
VSANFLTIERPAFVNDLWSKWNDPRKLQFVEISVSKSHTLTSAIEAGERCLKSVRVPVKRKIHEYTELTMARTELSGDDASQLFLFLLFAY